MSTISKEDSKSQAEKTSQEENTEETPQIENAEETPQVENAEETPQEENDEETPELEYIPPPLMPIAIITMKHAPRSHLEDLFYCFDSDQSGYLSPKELVSLSFALGLETNEEQILEDFKNADENNDGKISKEEFFSWFKLGGLGIGDTGNLVKNHMKIMSSLEEIERKALDIEARNPGGEYNVDEETRQKEEHKL